MEEAMWPATWKMPRGAVDNNIARVGYLGRDEIVAGRNRDNDIKSSENIKTKANWMRVSVTGCGKALRIDFDEVFESAEVRYLETAIRQLLPPKTPRDTNHTRQSAINFHDTGALKLSTTSLAVTLAARFRPARIASDMLCRLP